MQSRDCSKNKAIWINKKVQQGSLFYNNQPEHWVIEVAGGGESIVEMGTIAHYSSNHQMGLLGSRGSNNQQNLLGETFNSTPVQQRLVKHVQQSTMLVGSKKSNNQPRAIKQVVKRTC